MKKDRLAKFFILNLILFALTGCGGKSSVTGETLPIDRVCGYEKWKPVAVEGFLALQTMSCERAKGKRKGGITGCTFTIYADRNQTGAGVPVQILTTDWLSANNNRMEEPAFSSRLEELRIYDNEGNPIPPGRKIRVFGQLPKAERCDLGLAQRIEPVS